MVSYRATVRNGRVELDEPVELVEGQVVSVVVDADRADLEQVDELDDEDRARLHAAIDAGIEDWRAGRTHSLDDVLRAMPLITRTRNDVRWPVAP